MTIDQEGPHKLFQRSAALASSVCFTCAVHAGSCTGETPRLISRALERPPRSCIYVRFKESLWARAREKTRPILFMFAHDFPPPLALYQNEKSVDWNTRIRLNFRTGSEWIMKLVPKLNLGYKIAYCHKFCIPSLYFKSSIINFCAVIKYAFAKKNTLGLKSAPGAKRGLMTKYWGLLTIPTWMGEFKKKLITWVREKERVHLWRQRGVWRLAAMQWATAPVLKNPAALLSET